MKKWFLPLFIGLYASQAFGTDLGLEQRVVEHTCPNGIKVLILERHYSPTVAIRMMFRTGGVDEASGKTGLAHMFEHMMFKGTRTWGTKNYAEEAPLLAQIDQLHRQIDLEKSKGVKADQNVIAGLLDAIEMLNKKVSALVIEEEIWNLYEREGASDLNAATSADFTQYVLDLPSNKIALWLMIDSDRVKNPVFREFYSEREVVKEERRMRIDTNPKGKLYEHFLATAFIAHSYHHPTIGWDSDLDHLSVADLQDFYNRYYTPNRLTISIVGDINAKTLLPQIDAAFGTWTKAPSAEAEIFTQEPPQSGPRSVTVEADAQPELLLGFHRATYPDRDHFITNALPVLLTGGQSSRLYKILVEKKGVATDVSSDASTPGDRFDNLFIITATPRHPHTVEEIQRLIAAELENLKKKLLEPWELEKMRAAAEVSLLNTLQSNNGMADELAYDQCIFGDWRYLLKAQKAFETLTAQDLQRVAQTIFRDSNETVGILMKKKS